MSRLVNWWQMLSPGQWYAKRMFAWETALTTRDTNRIVRPLEWGFDWLPPLDETGRRSGGLASDGSSDLARMAALNRQLAADPTFFSYTRPVDFRLERRYPQLFPTNVRPETLAQDARMKQLAAAGRLAQAEYLRFTSPVRSPHPENDQVNARWFPASAAQEAKFRRFGKPRQALIVMAQWNADGLSHNALCEIFNRFGISCLRLSKPYHDIRRPPELERSDYACSSNIGRTIAAFRQAVVDIRSCCDWLEQQGYAQLGVLGTSLGSAYAFVAAAMDARLQVCAFNHASLEFGDVVWTGQSTRHIRQAFAEAGLTQDDARDILHAVSPAAYMRQFATNARETLVVHATYDLTFLEEFSQRAIRTMREHGAQVLDRTLPCGHYTTGETPYKFIDAWYLGKFMHDAYKRLAFANQTTP